MIRKIILPFALGAIASSSLIAGDLSSRSSEQQPISLLVVNAEMSEDEYRHTYRKNQRQILNFIETYSENTLLSLGLPEKGVHMMGAIAGLAANQDASFYLNDSKSLAIDIKDAAEDDRAIYFGFKLDW